MEFPSYDVVPRNGFEYPSVQEINHEILAARRENRPIEMNDLWLPDQIWSQWNIGRDNDLVGLEWPRWAERMHREAIGPGAARLTGGRAFQGAFLLADENRRYTVRAHRRLDRLFDQVNDLQANVDVNTDRCHM